MINKSIIVFTDTRKITNNQHFFLITMTQYFVVKRGNIVVYRHFYFTLKINIVRETMFENVIP